MPWVCQGGVRVHQSDPLELPLLPKDERGKGERRSQNGKTEAERTKTTGGGREAQVRKEERKEVDHESKAATSMNARVSQRKTKQNKKVLNGKKESATDPNGYTRTVCARWGGGTL